MTRVLHRPKRDEDVLLAACATSRPAPIATTLPPLPLGAPARSHAAMAELHAAERTSAVADHHRYDPNRLLPRHAMVRRVTPARVVRDNIDTVTADVVAVLQARPELRHEHALLMYLAPIVAWLKEVDVPETSDAERWAAQHRMNDAVDVLGVGDVVITYDPGHPYIGIQGTVTAVNGTAVTVQFTDQDIRTLPASELVLSVRSAAMLKGSVA